MPTQLNTILYNVAAPDPGKIWQPAYWYAADGGISVNTSSWVINPFNPNTSLTRVYDNSIVTNLINLVLDVTPTGYSDFCGSQRYISGTIHSRPTFRQLYGYFEISLSVPLVPGIFYTFSLQTDQQNPPQIDVVHILALQGTTKWFNQVGVWDVPSTSLLPANTWTSATDDNFIHFDITQVHSYGVNWQESGTDFYIDQIKVFHSEPLAGYTVPMFPVVGVNCGIDGIGAGPITNPTLLPATMQIGYIKVWNDIPF